MKISRRVRDIASATVAGMLVGIAYALLNDGLRAGPIMNGVYIGGVIGACAGVFETSPIQLRLRRQAFLSILLIRTALYLTLTVVVVLGRLFVYEAYEADLLLVEVYTSEPMQRFLFEGGFLELVLVILIAIFVWNLSRQVRRLLGPGRMLSMVLGRYREPREEQRVFLLIQVAAASAVTQRLGSLRWHALLNDCFHDISQAIERSGGELLQYTGDEVLVAWPAARQAAASQAVRCFFRAQSAMESMRYRYERTYGLMPAFPAAAHIGNTIVGELGDLKRDIVYHGEAPAGARAILASRTTDETQLLISEALERAIDGSTGLRTVPAGQTEHPDGGTMELFQVVSDAGSAHSSDGAPST